MSWFKRKKPVLVHSVSEIEISKPLAIEHTISLTSMPKPMQSRHPHKVLSKFNEHNREKQKEFFLKNAALATGVACPKCQNELYDLSSADQTCLKSRCVCSACLWESERWV